MAWSLFALVLLVVYLAQTSVLDFVPPQAVFEHIDLLLALALACGFLLPAMEARLAGWIVGFAQDVGSTDPLGLHAFMCGLMVLALTHLREVVNQQVWWVRWLVAFLVAWPGLFLTNSYLRVAAGSGVAWSTILGHSFLMALIAALLGALAGALPAVLGSGSRRYSPGRW